MTIYEHLEYFKASEFKHPDLISHDILRFIDKVRGMTRIPFLVTSDGRDRSHNARIGGARNSLHIYVPGSLDCRAIDFVFPARVYVNRSERWKAHWKITAAVMQAAETMTIDGASLLPHVQFEIVHSEADRHFHLGLFQDPVGPELIVAAD